MLDPLSNSLDRYMTLVSVRQKLVASNVANADTPGYKTQDIDFESELHNAAAGTSPLVNTVPGLRVKNDGNNVESRIAKRVCWRKTRCASAWRPTCCVRN